MKTYLLIIPTVVLFLSCQKEPKKNIAFSAQKENPITCTDSGCTGTYVGPEFVKGDDVAHQFSNQMCAAVGYKLKALYAEKKYRQVDFTAIKMTTKGMGSGTVTYTLAIPFKTVQHKCDAFTSFDHVGGWNHTPALAKRLNELRSVTLNGHVLNISDLKTTPEGLKEYWIQWKNKTVQADCE